MMRVQIWEALAWTGLLSLSLLATACGDRGGGVASLRPLVPAQAGGWQAADHGEFYDQESIFSYIDGHAEVYLAYGMKGCLARRYTGPSGEADIALDVFEMGSPADAYGVASYDRDGESVDIGHDGRLRYGRPCSTCMPLPFRGNRWGRWSRRLKRRWNGCRKNRWKRGSWKK